jgi:hypothetical protein
MRTIKVKSLQGRKPDCLLHSLINVGIYKTYRDVKCANKKVLGLLKSIVPKEAICEGFFVSVAFIPIAIKLKTKKFPRLSRRFSWLHQLPKKGKYLVSIYTEDGPHAVAVKNGLVFDSHWEIAIPMEVYGNHRIVQASCYKVK